MDIQAIPKKLLKHESESQLYYYMYNEKKAIVKHRFISSETNINSILKIIKEQTITEARAIYKCIISGIAVPTLYLIDLKNCKIIMERVPGLSVHKFLKHNYKNTKAVTNILFEIGVILSKMHKSNVSHGNLSTSNMLLKENGSIALINFGSSCLNSSTNDKVMDLYNLKHSFINMHWHIANKFELILIVYKEYDINNFHQVLKNLNHLNTSTMIDLPENKKSSYIQHKSVNALTPKKSLRNNVADEVLYNNVDREHSPKKTTPKSRELKINIIRIDETNYISMTSSQSLKTIKNKSQENTSPKTLSNQITQKMSPKKSPRWSKSVGHNSMKLIEELIPKDDEDILSTPKKRTRRTSVTSTSSNSNIINTMDSITPKRIRKPVNRFGEFVDVNEEEIAYTPPERKRKLRTSSKSNTLASILAVTPKHLRKPENQFDKLADTNDLEIANTTLESRRIRRTSKSSTPNKSNDIINNLDSITPKRIRKPVKRFGESVDCSEMEEASTPLSNKRNKKMSIELLDEDNDFEIDIWKTPVTKHLRRSMTPTTYSGSKVRRSILQDIPETKEIEVISSPKTPRKTPKAHVKKLTASANRRLDSGAKIPFSPLEKARASLHLHAAPKHLPCREVEFKSIYSFLARKINDELTGSMYISGVPGTGKTATVKRVIDSLNDDLIMKHSFKFIEINGLRLANPHQAFSVIWKELTTHTVSSSRAQALLNDYFSGKEVRELSTILLVDEVDHICNRKQDVVYNILDWPSRIGSKVVVITIANTMDLPERVLRGCVTSRMGLTRLVFKPYTFQQLQEIITNRLIGNSSFDPDAVQLVARKVAAVSGDARRALDICRRAIDLIKSEDNLQLITINHVNQILNSILSGVRVTAIRYCTLQEQFFLKALRDETNRTGFDHSTIDSIYYQMKSICLLEGEELPNDQEVIRIAYRLRDTGLIFLEKKRWDIFRKVSLNVSPEDISYALDKNNN